MTLDSSGATTVLVSANLTASNYDLSGAVINLGSGTDAGLVISTGLIGKFAGADIVRLRSASVFNLYGNNNFGDAGNRIGTLTLDGAGLYSDGGTTAITARDIVFVNTQSGTDLSGANTSRAGRQPDRRCESGTLIFGAGSKTLSGLGRRNRDRRVAGAVHRHWQPRCQGCGSCFDGAAVPGRCIDVAVAPHHRCADASRKAREPRRRSPRPSSAAC